MYEMLVGYPPFYSDDPMTTCRKVSPYPCTSNVIKDSTIMREKKSLPTGPQSMAQRLCFSRGAACPCTCDMAQPSPHTGRGTPCGAQIVNWRTHLKFPEEANLSREARDLICRLLCDVEHRLGTRSVDDIKVSPWRTTSLQGQETAAETLCAWTLSMPAGYVWFLSLSGVQTGF